MAQTREHLAILQLTGNPMLTVALTKADRVDEARVDEVERQVKEVLREYGFAEAKLFITAATEGRGIDALREHLLQLPGREHASQHSFRLAIDRAFTVKGAGLVVTGTALSGEVKVGDSLWLTGVNKPMRVRALHAQNQPTETAHAGQRIALNIAGDAEKEQINRGDWLLADAPPEPFTRVIVELQTHTPLTQWQPLHIHHAASHVTGRVSLLEDNLAELVFDTPLWLADNDRLVPVSYTHLDVYKRQGTGGFFAPACTPGPSGFSSAPRSGRTMPASGGFPHSPGQPGFHFPAGRASAPCRRESPTVHRQLTL